MKVIRTAFLRHFCRCSFCRFLSPITCIIILFEIVYNLATKHRGNLFLPTKMEGSHLLIDDRRVKPFELEVGTVALGRRSVPGQMTPRSSAYEAAEIKTCPSIRKGRSRHTRYEEKYSNSLPPGSEEEKGKASKDKNEDRIEDNYDHDNLFVGRGSNRPRWHARAISFHRLGFLGRHNELLPSRPIRLRIQHSTPFCLFKRYVSCQLNQSLVWNK